jgi:selina-4(15),7(11)-diene synthase
VTVISVPEVRSPFPSRLNRYTAEAEARALLWARRIGLIGAAQARGLAGQRFGQLAGRCHPDFGPARLTDICRWYLWFAVLDDRYCDRREEAGDLAQRLAVISRVLEDPGTATTDPVAVAAADLVPRTRGRASHEQYRRLVLGFQATFFGLLWELSARGPHSALSARDYLGMRPYTGALPAFVTLTEIHGGRPPTPQQVALPEVGTLVNRLGNLIMWQNDIRSYPAEVASGHPVLSLPTVLEQERGLPPESALALAAAMWHDEVRAYRGARAAVLALGTPALRRYADLLHNLLAGFLAWHYETARYD